MTYRTSDSGGLTFTSGGEANGTKIFGWCGLNCGGVQLIDVAATSGGLFNLESIDAGNLAPTGSPNGWVSDMTVELLGYQNDGSTDAE